MQTTEPDRRPTDALADLRDAFNQSVNDNGSNATRDALALLLVSVASDDGDPPEDFIAARAGVVF